MDHLARTGLGQFVKERSQSGQPLIGLCLGMQLLMDESVEHQRTAGLGLIPGRVVPLEDGSWHIGWNTIENISGDTLLQSSDGQAVYFNHSYVVETSAKHHLCRTRFATYFASGVRRKGVVGLQFHPEKSQAAGREILHGLIEGLCGA
jgi:imidazole glycerol phosphate synthase glutamine amidotransferase subunit